MRFDDRLMTVLDQPATDPHDRAVRWRQLVDLVARSEAQSGNPLYFMYRHLIYLAIGFVSCGVVMLIPMATWQRFGFPLLIIAFLLLVAVLVPGIGREVNGSLRWIGFGIFNVQPSEIAKVFVVLYLAGYLVRRQHEVRHTWAGFFKPFIVLLPMAMLLLREPDFGATVVMMGAAGAMLFLGSPLLAHPGHGTTDPASPAHLAEPVHAGPILAGAAAIAVALTLAWRARRPRG